MENNLVFQPYGKDDLYFNFLATMEGSWFFGPCDISSFDKISKSAVVHTYVKLHCKNPKYAKHALPKDFQLKEERKIIKIANRSELKGINELYVFIVYSQEDSFMFMEYTPDYDEYKYIKDNFNMLTSFIIIGDSIDVVDEKLGTGIGAPPEIIMTAIEEMKNEID